MRDEVLHAGDAYGEVETFLDEVDKAVIQPHIENDIGLLGAEIDEALADVRISKGSRGRDLDAASDIAAQFAHRFLQALDLTQDFTGALIVGVARFGQRKLPRGAVEEQCSEFIFQFAHIFGQESLGPPDLPRCGGKTFRFHDVDKSAHAGERVHQTLSAD